MDRWDGVGVTGALAIGAGVWALTSWPWAVIFWGALLGACPAGTKSAQVKRAYEAEKRRRAPVDDDAVTRAEAHGAPTLAEEGGA